MSIRRQHDPWWWCLYTCVCVWISVSYKVKPQLTDHKSCGTIKNDDDDGGNDDHHHHPIPVWQRKYFLLISFYIFYHCLNLWFIIKNKIWIYSLPWGHWDFVVIFFILFENEEIELKLTIFVTSIKTETTFQHLYLGPWCKKIWWKSVNRRPMMTIIIILIILCFLVLNVIICKTRKMIIF